MTDTDKFLSFFEFKNNVLTLGEILQTHFSAEYRKHISLLRNKGYKIECKLNKKKPSENTYTLLAPIAIRYEGNQGCFA